MMQAGVVVEQTSMSGRSEHAGACVAPCDADQAHARAETPWLASKAGSRKMRLCERYQSMTISAAENWTSEIQCRR